LCGLAYSYHALLLGRLITGVFAGVVGSVSFAIVTDVFPLEMRGRVMGVIHQGTLACRRRPFETPPGSQPATPLDQDGIGSALLAGLRDDDVIECRRVHADAL
jgi:hypothetical protein